MKAKLFFLQCTLPTVYMPQRKKREPKQDYLPTGDKWLINKTKYCIT